MSHSESPPIQVFDEPSADQPAPAPPPPIVTNMPGEIGIYMQAGLVKDTVKLDTSELTLKTLKEYACNFVDRKVSGSFVLPLWGVG